MSGRTLMWLVLASAAWLMLARTGAAMWKQNVTAQKWLLVLNDAERRHQIPPDLLARMAYQESHWRDDVITGSLASTAGALGLMQMMPAYFSSVRTARPFTDRDTAAQIEQAAAELARLHAVFRDWVLAVGAYNAGQGTVRAYVAGTRSLPAETQDYVADVFADIHVPA